MSDAPGKIWAGRLHQVGFEEWATDASTEPQDGYTEYTRSDLVESLRAERDALEDVLRRHGFRRCDTPACNCGSWHHVDGLAARFREIEEALTAADVEMNGVTLLAAIQGILHERDTLRAEVERLRDLISFMEDADE